MKKLSRLSLFIYGAALLLGGCKLDRFPKKDFSDNDYWNTENDLIYATNRMYEQLDGNWIDNRADDATNQTANAVSNGTRTVPNTSGDWNDRYDEIFTANNILDKAGKADVSDAIKNRYLAEAHFFRAYAYFLLVQKYGDVPLVLHTLDIGSPELTMPRSARADVMTSIYEDLDFAAQWLPTRAQLPATQWGRVTKSTAWGLKARAALYEGTREKFWSETGWEQHLQLAIDAVTNIRTQGHALYSNYGNLFLHPGEGPTNTENIFVKVYGVNNTNVILGHNNSRDLENGRLAITRNLIRQYLYTDGLPAFNTDGSAVTTPSPLFVPEGSEASYNTVFENRDPRLKFTVFLAGEQAYKGPWVPLTSLGSRTAYATKKGWNQEDWAVNSTATVDRILIRYGEMLLIYAEAKYELDGSISDADLDLTINALRTRAGLTVKLTNAFVTANSLNMREEIRRERTIELALEGFRYDDLVRWKTAETVLPKDILGAKYNEIEWVGTHEADLKLNADKVLITEPASTRTFDPTRDYLYPVPLHEISTSGGNVKQNPNWH